jgi:hypothetical protein
VLPQAVNKPVAVIAIMKSFLFIDIPPFKMITGLPGTFKKRQNR